MANTPPARERRRDKLREGVSRLFSSPSPSAIVADNGSASEQAADKARIEARIRDSSPSITVTTSSSETESLASLPTSLSTVTGLYSNMLPDHTQLLSNSSHHAPKKIGNAGFDGLKTTLKLIERSADVFTPLKSAIGGLLGAIELVEAIFQNKQDREDLQRKLEAVVSIIQRHRSLSQSDVLKYRLDGLLMAVNNQLSAIHIHKDRSFARRLASGDETQQIAVVYRTISYLFDAFQTDTALASEIKVEEIQAHLWFDKLLQARYAEYDARSPAQRHACTTNTRKTVLAELIAWAADANNTKIYWLNGMAGTGKTTIAYSFSEILEKNQMLGASYFCYRQDDSGDVGLVFPTIACQLARRFSVIFHAVVAAVRSDSQIGSRSLQRQFQELLVKPLKAASQHLQLRPPVIVIEAMDECSNQASVADMLSIISRHASTLPVKFFISSRPEPQIRQSFNRRGVETPLYLILHEIEHNLVTADIELYTKARLADIADGRDEEGPFNDWPPESELKTLVRLSGNLFIYAATACAYIAEGSIRKRLSSVANISAGAANHGTSALDALYCNILTAAYKSANAEEKEDITLVLRTVVSVFRPLSISGLDKLLNVSAGFALSALHSLVYIPSSQDFTAPISSFHTSFPDYISDRGRAGNEFWLDPVLSHRNLAINCLAFMKVSLRETISYSYNRQREHISESLGYSCAYWPSHLIKTSFNDEADDIHSVIREFFDTNVLRWIDCLSILGQLKMAVDGLRKLEAWAQGDPGLLNDITDTRLFISENFDYIGKHSLVDYPPALIWLPDRSVIRKKYGSEEDSPWKIILGSRKTWNICEAVLVGHSTSVAFVTFSPDGSHIASGSENTIHIWNAMTGQSEAELKGHSARVTSVVFSLDNIHMASSSNDNTIRIWNASTWESEVELNGHTNWVISISFSPDSTRIVSASRDHTIRIWNVMTGDLLAELKGHEDWVMKAAFSLDSTRIVSASRDKVFRIWNSMTGKAETEIKGKLEPEFMHWKVFAMAISPDRSCVASSRGHVIHLWKFKNGYLHQELLNGHSYGVSSMEFSADSTRMVSAAYDSNICIWNVITGKLEAELKGHSASINSVVFSPDNSRIASAADDNAVRVWNAKTGILETELKGHSAIVTSVVFSPDNTRIASASDDSTVRVWNASARDSEDGQKNYSCSVNSVFFSLDGSRVASTSKDNIVRIWNLTTRNFIETQKKHSYRIKSVFFSPDNSRIASVSFDNSIHIWNTETGNPEAELLGNFSWINVLIFSPDSGHIACASDDNTIYVWNALTGKAQAELIGHTDWVNVFVFSPDSSHIASASHDSTVRIWNVATRQSERELKGYSDGIHSVIFSLDGNHLLVSASGKIDLWNLITGEIESPEFPAAGLPSSPNLAPERSLVVDDHWIHSKDLQSHQTNTSITESCWIPPLFRKPTAIAYHGSKVCFGYPSGEVIALEYVRNPRIER